MSLKDRSAAEFAVWPVLLFCLGTLLSGGGRSCQPAFAAPASGHMQALAATRFPEAERGFESRNGWIGGDGAYSLLLASDTVLWLFGDSFYGNVRGGRRLSRVMVHNAVALQYGRDPARATWRFCFGRPTPLPESFFQPPDHRGYFWPLHGIRTARGLFVFLLQIEPTKDDSVFGFRPIGSWLVQVPDADLSCSPDHWRCVYRKIPWASFTPTGNRFFGSSVLWDDDGLLIYGIDERCPDLPTGKKLLLARVSGDNPGRFGTWRFLETRGDGKRSPPVFGRQMTRAVVIADGLSTEFSVHRAAAGGAFSLIHMAPGLSPEILMRTASASCGPWNPAVNLFRCPVEVSQRPGSKQRIKGPLFAYAAKAHPELKDDLGGLLVTWVINSFDFFDLARAAELYRPRFIRLQPSINPDADAP